MSNKILKSSLIAIAIIACMSGSTWADIIYVDASKNGDGSSWANANPSLQISLLGARYGDEIWVAAGTYYPIQDASPSIIIRTISFELKNGVAIYGGYPSGGGTRDWVTNVTILSGDMGVLGDDTDNSYHVVVGSGTVDTAILDGVTVSGGKADGNYSNSQGAGIYNSQGSPTISNVIISENSAHSGGGVYNGSSNPTLINVTISDNSAHLWGGGIYNLGSSPTLTNVTISGNSAYQGGGIDNTGSNPTLTNVTISGNSAAYGGGVENNSSNPSFTNVTISGNSAYNGGGIFNSESNPTLTNVIISGNSADDGGGIKNSGSSPTLSNVTISGNLADYGGGIYNTSTISSATSMPPGYFFLDSNPILTNVIIWKNTTTSSGNSIYTTAHNGNIPEISHSIIESDDHSNPEDNPLFVSPLDPDNAPSIGGNFHLQANSPAIDTGDNAAVSGVIPDLDGNSRISNGTVDMGAYEYTAPLLVFTPLQDTYAVGEVMTLSLETHIIVDTSFEYADLWIAIKMPNSEFLFLTTMPFEPFSLIPQPFMTSVENVEDIYSILLFTVPAGIGGNYTFYAAYIEEGKNPMTDELSAILLSNLATTQMVLRNQ